MSFLKIGKCTWNKSVVKWTAVPVDKSYTAAFVSVLSCQKAYLFNPDSTIG
jgi:hypothetical protein